MLLSVLTGVISFESIASSSSSTKEENHGTVQSAAEGSVHAGELLSKPWRGVSVGVSSMLTEGVVQVPGQSVLRISLLQVLLIQLCLMSHS